MFFNKFRRQSDDKLNLAHSLGLGAIGLFEELADDLKLAGELAGEHAEDLSAEILVLRMERDSAYEAETRYEDAAERVRGLVA